MAYDITDNLKARVAWNRSTRLPDTEGTTGVLVGGASFTVNDANPQSIADGYALLGARLTLNDPDERWSLAIFGSNLTNTHYRPLAVYQPLGGALGLNNGAFPGSTANRILANEPRTYGVSATLRF